MKMTGKLATEPENKENHPIFQWGRWQRYL